MSDGLQWDINDIIDENGEQKYKLKGTGKDNEGQIQFATEDEIKSGKYSVPGYNAQIPRKETENDRIKITNKNKDTEKRNPTDPRLEKIIDFNGQNATVQRPFNSDDMTDGTGGLYEKEKSKKDSNANTKGVPAIMNQFAIVQLKGAYSSENDKMYSLIDTPGKRRWYEDYKFGGASDNMQLNDINYSKDVTVSKLIDFGLANKRKTTPYYYTDFAYCKYFNKIPNNYLITLRRYAVPTFDSLDFPFIVDNSSHILSSETKIVKDANGNDIKIESTQEKYEFDNSEPVEDTEMTAPPVAQAVTWLGEATGNTFEKIMSFSVGLEWKNLEAEVWENSGSGADAEGSSGMSGWMQGFAKALSIGTGGGNANTIRTSNTTPPDPYKNGPYANRILGPVNRIQSVKQRVAPLKFEQTLSLDFHYTARSIGGINTKAAMLDIISNFLLLTYGTGGFWGGANRFTGSSPAYPWKKGMAAWYSGNPVKFMSAIGSSLEVIGKKLSSMLDNLIKDPIETLKSVASTAGEFAMADKLKGHYPMMQGIRSLLTGEPTGSWHLVVGNPFNPIMMIGNLICTGCEFKFGSELGPDDFPTEMTITVKLEHGMPRDRYAVESMFNKGAGRIYTLPDGFEESWAGNIESTVDKHTGSRNPYINRNMEVDKLTKGGKLSKFATGAANFDSFVESGKKTFKGVAESGTLLAQKIEMGYNS